VGKDQQAQEEVREERERGTETREGQHGKLSNILKTKAL
jgi:hypothetical protein